jgi:hypothetical protein
MNHYLAVQAQDEFYPEFYVTVATVLPILLLVGNLTRAYVRQRPGITHLVLEMHIGLILLTTTKKVALTFVLAILMACMNIMTEVTCLIVLFLRHSGTVTSVIIWVGVGCSLAWTLLLLSAYIAVDTPRQLVADDTSEDE